MAHFLFSSIFKINSFNILERFSKKTLHLHNKCNMLLNMAHNQFETLDAQDNISELAQVKLGELTQEQADNVAFFNWWMHDSE